MNRAANRVGYRAAAGPLSMSPHVRARAACPDQTRPDQSPARPVQRSPKINGMNNSNGNTDLLRQCNRRARAGNRCWACHSTALELWCERCGAPPWGGTVVNADTFAHDVEGFGVYVLGSEVGMVKVGVATSLVQRRAGSLVDEAVAAGVACWTRALLPSAGRMVEQWLLNTLPGRDSMTAVAMGLPNPTEWLHDSEAVDRIVAGLPWWPGR